MGKDELCCEDKMYEVVEQFEKEIAKYAGSKYACAVNSCTNAILLACSFHKVNEVTIPKHTYVSVPQSILHAGGTVKFDDREWQGVGAYQLEPSPIWDSARLLTSDMHVSGRFECLSLHWGKTLNLGQGGVILHDSTTAQKYFERARFDGKTPGVAPKDDKPIIGWHCFMTPRDAADALTRLHFLPEHNDPLPYEPGYPNLEEAFKGVLCGWLK